MKSDFGNFQRYKNVIFGNFKGSEFWFFVFLINFQVPNSSKWKFRVSKFAKNNIFGLFEFTKIGFHVVSEWQKKDQISTKSSLKFTFWKFLEHSVVFSFLSPCISEIKDWRFLECRFLLIWVSIWAIYKLEKLKFELENCVVLLKVPLFT